MLIKLTPDMLCMEKKPCPLLQNTQSHDDVTTKNFFFIGRNFFFFEEAPSDSQVVWAIDLIQGLCEMFFVFMLLLLTGKCYIQTTYLSAVL